MIPNYSNQETKLTFIEDEESLLKLRGAHPDKAVALLFWASWHEPCNLIKTQMEELTKTITHVVFTWVCFTNLRLMLTN